jgi:hypothetical protein
MSGRKNETNSISQMRSGPCPLQAMESHLAAYAMTAAAAGVGVLATARPANAEIVYTTAHTTFTNGVLFLDLNHDGTNDFGLSIYNFDEHDRRFSPIGLNDGNGILDYTGPSYPPLAVFKGYRIDQRELFWRREAPAVNVVATFGTIISGPFANVGIRYLGLRFKVDGEVYFGWAAVNVKAAVKNHIPGIEATLLGYAYENEPRKSILAGDTGRTSNSTNAEVTMPEPELAASSLGMLALGWRREGLQIDRR